VPLVTGLATGLGSRKAAETWCLEVEGVVQTWGHQSLVSREREKLRVEGRPYNVQPEALGLMGSFKLSEEVW
jgi:hypothetical protein